MIRVLLVDDHVIVRAGLERLLEQTDDIEVVGIADHGRTAVELNEQLHPDVVLMDLSMPIMDGVEATRLIRTRDQTVPVVMLTAYSDRRRVLDALDAGASGYLVKDADPETVLGGVRAAARGDAPLDARAARVLLDTRSKRSAPKLTDRELEVLRLVASGLANKQIARQLRISDKTVKAHLTRIFNGLGVTDRTQAALWAREHLEPESVN